MSEKHPPVQLCSVFSIRVCPPFDSVILPRSSIAPSHRNESSPQAQAQTKSAKEILRYPYAIPTQSWTSRSSRGASGETRDAASCWFLGCRRSPTAGPKTLLWTVCRHLRTDPAKPTQRLFLTNCQVSERTVEIR